MTLKHAMGKHNHGAKEIMEVKFMLWEKELVIAINADSRDISQGNACKEKGKEEARKEGKTDMHRTGENRAKKEGQRVEAKDSRAKEKENPERDRCMADAIFVVEHILLRGAPK